MADITVPALGESVTEAVIAQWLKKPGDAVKTDEPLVELETDKVTVEVNATTDGVLGEIAYDEGAEVEVGTVLGQIDEKGATASKSSEKTEKKTEAETDDKTEEKKATNGADSAAPIDVSVPDMGESVTEGTIGQWLKKPGDQVAADEPLVEIETDKVTAEINAPQAGVLSEALVSEGDTVEVGAVVARLVPGEGASAPEKTEAAGSESDGGKDPGPAVRKLAKENDVDLSQVLASGKDGRPTKGDVLAYIEKKESAPPTERETRSSAPQSQEKTREEARDKPKESPSRAAGPREERVRMSRLRQRIAERLKEAQDTAAMLTTFNEVDMSAILELRKQYKEAFERKHGIKLGFMSFFAKAAAQALKEFPAVNAEIDGTDIVYKNYYDIGIAVSTPSGLMVPVVRDCDSKSFAQIEKDIVEFGMKARDGKIAMEDLQGGTFTITNGGVFGSLNSTPILNPPQSGILGMHKTQERPVAIGGQVVVRPMMNIALSYDHRIVDGREAVSFLVRIKEGIEDPQRLLLEM